ncbi:hypothetical protein EKN56_06680 [Limnobaculum zhutongyuii]|uniref:Uncharacterized protein n=1 Tax=Limnobaculum zhutongyuii TaxID=2498113 RepID=A0A411WIV2_9GAMM|nr:hypothetical protein [Limnobaculum zhutongyuii]QBH96108.1 hypothetical protein EKN56_06680 [Limnobaculum zhutongyuii]TQS87241.1 hypothetical protein ELQ32_14655 [Limnobaculum zhutongyuii]
MKRFILGVVIAMLSTSSLANENLIRKSIEHTCHEMNDSNMDDCKERLFSIAKMGFAYGSLVGTCKTAVGLEGENTETHEHPEIEYCKEVLKRPDVIELTL